jgi:hypothetical protein
MIEVHHGIQLDGEAGRMLNRKLQAECAEG